MTDSNAPKPPPAADPPFDLEAARAHLKTLNEIDGANYLNSLPGKQRGAMMGADIADGLNNAAKKKQS